MDSGYEKGVMQFFLLMNGALAKKYRSWIVGGCTWHYTIIHIIHYYTIFIHILPCYLMFFQVPHHLHHLVAHHIHHAGARMSWKRLRRDGKVAHHLAETFFWSGYSGQRWMKIVPLLGYWCHQTWFCWKIVHLVRYFSDFNDHIYIHIYIIHIIYTLY